MFKMNTIKLLIALGLPSVSFAFAVPEAPSTVNAHYVNVSATIPLKPQEKIANLYHINQTEPYILQRLTERTYFFQRASYATTFYVGDKGVLLFDPLENNGPAILKAIQQVTALPITAIVYSHAHFDHIGDSAFFVAAAEKANIHLRIIASGATAQKLIRINSHLPKPTDVVTWPNGQFQFEHLTVQLHGFEHAAHADDHAVWLLTQEKVLHAADQMNPDQLPFWNFGGSENYLNYKDNLQAAEALDFQFVNAGHGNVGAKIDYDFYLHFLNDLEAATNKAMKNTPWGVNVDANTANNHAVYMVEWRKAVDKKVTDELRPQYGIYYGFEYTVPYNADMVALALAEYQ